MAQTPRWDLLPNRARDFFGLASGFDRKDLKRAYGALIKQFKPETHPQEFQSIREAYELLEEELRYGDRSATQNQQNAAWSSAVIAAARDHQPSVAADANNPRVCSFELAIENPKAFYTQLSKKTERSPQDYYILAAISDLVCPAEDSMYLKWLMTGIKEHPQDTGLLRLLSVYLSAHAAADKAPAILFTLSKIMAGDEFYPVTEKAWERLLAESDFATFAKALSACENQLRNRKLRSKLAFTIRIARRAIWKASRDWIDRVMNFIESHGSEIDHSLEEDAEFLVLLRNYIIHDRQSISNRSLGSTIDKMIETYCTRDVVTSLPELTEVCDTLGRSSHGLMQTFSGTPDESESRTLLLCHIIGRETAMLTGVDFGPSESRILERHADAAVGDLFKSLVDIGKKLQRMRYRVYGIPFVTLWLVPILLIIGFPYWFFISLIWTASAVCIFVAWLKPRYLGPKLERRSQDLVHREYGKQWRPRLFRYVQACHAPSEHTINHLIQSAKIIGQTQVVEIVLSYAQQDTALRLFGNLQLFVR